MSTVFMKKHKKNSIEISNTYFQKNMEFLFKYLKQTKGMQKKAFFEYLGLNRSTEFRWYQRGVIPRRNLERVLNFFNTNLDTYLTAEDLLNKNLENEFKKKQEDKIGVAKTYYLAPQERELVLLFRKINRTSQMKLIEFLKSILLNR